ncbi:MAG TPA: response regulator [Elusimicrobiota bacterium]|nr:response regulator [Elusimicrobiota bacterium]
MPRRWILIVDDDPMMLQMLEQFVRGPEIHVTTASDAKQAFIQARDLKPDLIISDMMMPGFYGTATLYELRKDPRTGGIPFIFVTGMAPAKAQALLPPNDPKIRLMTKPIEFAKLAEAVKELSGLVIGAEPGPEAKAS